MSKHLCSGLLLCCVLIYMPRALAATTSAEGPEPPSQSKSHPLEKQPPASAGTFILAPPTFTFMIGGTTTDAISPTAEDASAATYLHLIFVTVVPLALEWLSPLVAVSWLPDIKDNDNAPAFTYGFSFSITPLSKVTKQWVYSYVFVAGHFSKGGGKAVGGRYGHDLLFEIGGGVNVGQLFKNMGPLSGMNIYFMINQLLTNPPKNAAGQRDYFAPAFHYGISFLLAPWRYQTKK